MPFLESINWATFLTSFGFFFSHNSNLYAWHESISGNPTDVSGVPLYQTTPQAMNRNTNVCGKDQDAPGIDYDEWIDTQGNPMPWLSQATYSAGDTIEIVTTMKAHHKGHLTVGACPMGRESTQECFDSHPLEFVSDVLYGMPKDENFPDRGYLHGLKMDLHMEFKLPDDVAGKEVLLQWVYWTANSCNHEGYDDYFSGTFGAIPVSPGEPNWVPGLDDCPPEEDTPLAPLPNPALVGSLFAEVFINCAEVTILGDDNDDECEDDATFLHKNKAKKDCDWVAKKLSKGDEAICDYEESDGTLVSDACPLTCGICTPSCEDDADFFYKKEKKDCDWVAKKVDKKGDTEICDKEYDGVVVKDACPVACGNCSN